MGDIREDSHVMKLCRAGVSIMLRERLSMYVSWMPVTKPMVTSLSFIELLTHLGAVVQAASDNMCKYFLSCTQL